MGGAILAARANRKGWLRLDELACPVPLRTGASASGRIASQTVNRRIGKPV